MNNQYNSNYYDLCDKTQQRKQLILDCLQVKGTPGVFRKGIESIGNVEVCATTITKDLIVNRKAVLNNLCVNGATILNNVIINGYVDLANSIFVLGNIDTNNLNVDELATLNQLIVSGNALFQENTTFNKDVNICGNLDIKQSVEIGKDLFVDRDVFIDRNLSITKNTEICGNLTVKNDTQLNGELSVTKDIRTMNDLYVEGSTFIESDLNVTEDSELCGNVVIKNNSTINKNLNVLGNTEICGNLTIKNNLNVIKDTYIGGNTTIAKNLIANSILSMNDVNIYANTNIKGNLNVSGAIFGLSNVEFCQNATIKGNVQIYKDLFIGGNIYVEGNITQLDTAIVIMKDNLIALNNNNTTLSTLSSNCQFPFNPTITNGLAGLKILNTSGSNGYIATANNIFIYKPPNNPNVWVMNQSLGTCDNVCFDSVSTNNLIEKNTILNTFNANISSNPFPIPPLTSTYDAKNQLRSYFNANSSYVPYPGLSFKNLNVGSVLELRFISDDPFIASPIDSFFKFRIANTQFPNPSIQMIYSETCDQNLQLRVRTNVSDLIVWLDYPTPLPNILLDVDIKNSR